MSRAEVPPAEKRAHRRVERTRLLLVDGREYDLKAALVELRGFFFDRERLRFTQGRASVSLDDLEAIRESVIDSGGRRRLWTELDLCYLAPRAVAPGWRHPYRLNRSAPSREAPTIG